MATDVFNINVSGALDGVETAEATHQGSVPSGDAQPPKHTLVGRKPRAEGSNREAMYLDVLAGCCQSCLQSVVLQLFGSSSGLEGWKAARVPTRAIS